LLKYQLKNVKSFLGFVKQQVVYPIEGEKMSSDVYLYVLGTDPYSNTSRIGHLGIMCYFGFNALTSILCLEDKCNLIDDQWSLEMKKIVLTLDKQIESIKDLSEEEFSKRFGYYKPKPDEWSDRPTANMIDEILEESRGKKWRVSWD
jgi:hypothetical protein